MMKTIFVIVGPSGRVPEKASRLDRVVLELKAVDKYFIKSPRVFGILEYFRVIIEQTRVPKYFRVFIEQTRASVF